MTKCPKTGFEINDEFKHSYCRICQDKCSVITTRFELGKVDGFELARLLKEKNKEKNLDNIIKETEHYKLLTCPICYETSLYYDKHKKKKECLNKRCFSNSLSKYLTNKLLHSD